MVVLKRPLNRSALDALTLGTPGRACRIPRTPPSSGSRQDDSPRARVSRTHANAIGCEGRY
jgi:hypothetical protein